MKELGAKLDRNCDSRITVGENSAAHATTRFDDDDTAITCSQFAGSGESRRASSDDYRVDHARLIHSD
jgi:hypothetical protein